MQTRFRVRIYFGLLRMIWDMYVMLASLLSSRVCDFILFLDESKNLFLYCVLREIEKAALFYENFLVFFLVFFVGIHPMSVERSLL